MAAINSTQVKVLRTPISTTPTGTMGVTTGRGAGATINTTLDVPQATIRYELIKENLGDNPDAMYALETTNDSIIHGPAN